MDALPGSLKLVNSEPLSAGENFSVAFDAPPLLGGFRYSIELVRLLENGRALRIFQPTIKRGTHTEFPGGVEVGGQYAIRLILGTRGRRPNHYIVDSLVVQIGARKAYPGGIEFTIAGERIIGRTSRVVVKAEGRIIPVEVFLPIARLKTNRDAFHARLYRVDAIPAGHHAGWDVEYISPGSMAGDLVQEWPIEMGRKTAWNIDDKLTPGYYALTIPTFTFPNVPTPEFRYIEQEIVRYIEIVRFSSVKISLGGRRRFQYGESIPVSVTFPDTVSPEIKNHRLELELTKMGGHVPGCAIEFPIAYSPITIEPAKQLQPLTIPGPYEVGLYLMRLFSYDSGVTLDEVAFEVVSEPLPGAISLVGGSRYWLYRSGHSYPNTPELHIKGRVKLPADHPLAIKQEWKFSISVGLFRHGAIAVGGATSAVAPTNDAAEGVKPLDGVHWAIGTREPFIDTGSYEYRLFHRYGYDGVRKILIASAPFTVEDREWPYPLSHGLKSVSLQNDLITPNNPWPPVGEYLDGDNCEPEVVVVEKMDLRFVRWEEGEYVPVGHPLEFGEAFYIEGSLKAPAVKSSYLARVASPNGTEEEVALFRTEDDPKLVRSELLYFIWDSPEEEADGAAQ